LRIVEVIRRSDQGTTRPFLCRGDDGLLYYAKGRYAGRRSLCAEWVAGRLGQELRLPIPEMKIAAVPKSLLHYSAMPDIGDLGSGEVFASEVISDAQELAFNDIQTVPEALRLRVLLFDWWINNEDRTLTEFGGNPNLVWSAKHKGLMVIDHNLAFDESFDSRGFWQRHVFRREASEWPREIRVEMTRRMTEAVSKLNTIWSELPANWLHLAGR
jgi:hypothetical protein